jgi:transcriptional regulator with XRE-family HTH domain
MSQSEFNKSNLKQKLDNFLQCIGKEMSELRKSHNKSLKTVAKATKMSPGIISKVEKGQYDNLCLTRLLTLCKYYNVHIADVITRGEKYNTI